MKTDPPKDPARKAAWEAGPWGAHRRYQPGNVASHGGAVAVCVEPHLSTRYAFGDFRVWRMVPPKAVGK